MSLVLFVQNKDKSVWRTSLYLLFQQFFEMKMMLFIQLLLMLCCDFNFDDFILAFLTGPLFLFVTDAVFGTIHLTDDIFDLKSSKNVARFLRIFYRFENCCSSCIESVRTQCIPLEWYIYIYIYTYPHSISTASNAWVIVPTDGSQTEPPYGINRPTIELIRQILFSYFCSGFHAFGMRSFIVDQSVFQVRAHSLPERQSTSVKQNRKWEENPSGWSPSKLAATVYCATFFEMLDTYLFGTEPIDTWKRTGMT